MELQHAEDIHLTGAECVFAKGKHDPVDFSNLVAIEYDWLIATEEVEHKWLRWVPLRTVEGTYVNVLNDAEPYSRGAFIATFYDVKWHGISEVPASWKAAD